MAPLTTSLVKMSSFTLSVPKVTCLFGVASLEVARQLLRNRRNAPLLGIEEHEKYSQYETRLQKLIHGGSLPTLESYLSTALDEVLKLNGACSKLVSQFKSRFDEERQDSEFLATSFGKKVADCSQGGLREEFPQIKEHPVKALELSATKILERVERRLSLVTEFRSAWNKLTEDFAKPFRIEGDDSKFNVPGNHSESPLQAALACFLSVISEAASEIAGVDKHKLSKVCEACKSLPDNAAQLSVWYVETCVRSEAGARKLKQVFGVPERFAQLLDHAHNIYKEQLCRVLSQPKSSWVSRDGRGGTLHRNGISIQKPYVCVPASNFRDAIAAESSVQKMVVAVENSELSALMKSAEAELSKLVSERNSFEAEEMKKSIMLMSQLKSGFIKKGAQGLEQLCLDKARAPTSTELQKQQKRVNDIAGHLDSAEAIYRSHREIAKTSLTGRLKDWAGLQIDDEAPILDHLANASDLVVKSGWSVKSDAYQTLNPRAPLIREISEYCLVIYEWKPTVRKPKLDMSLPCRKLPPLDVFINALCSLAAADGAFCREEKKTIVEFLLKYRICDQKSAVAAISSWINSARKIGTINLMNQCIRDVVDLREHGGSFAKALPAAMRLVAKADGGLDESEKHINRLVTNAINE